ncbi:MAG TPA: acyloxyacyl hydrolase [Candidatus Angelobacter sp.]|nr:acyloxyacyl hydrolase [Candidatus Angelobacter sp.]
MKLAYVFFLLCGMAAAQDDSILLKRPWQFGFWGGGGVSVFGGSKDVSTATAGLRIGKMLSREIGDGQMRGVFEWSADVIPLYYFVQPNTFKGSNNTYGASFNPLNMTWNFTAPKTITPYAEIGGGVLFTSKFVPETTTANVNFTTHAGLGFHYFVRENQAITIGARYEHISNAGLNVPNPGVNTVQITVGYNWFRKHRK